MPKKYRYIGSAPTDLACGKIVSTGADTTDVNPKDPHDADLIARGLLVEQAPAKKAAQAAPTTEDGQ